MRLINSLNAIELQSGKTNRYIQTDINPNFEGWPKAFAETDAAVLSLSWSQRLLRGQGKVFQ